MSVFMFNQAVICSNVLLPSDDRVAQPWERYISSDENYGWKLPWPSSRNLGSDTSAIGLGADAQCTSGYWEWDVRWQGARSRKVFKGITQDVNGLPLGGVTVSGFVTANDAFIGSVVSDITGVYVLPTPFASTAHYLVSYKTGTPDLEGTTRNDILPDGI